MADEITPAERDRLMERSRALDAELFPSGGAAPPAPREAARIRERFYHVLAEYSDRLPRRALSACPFCGEVLRRTFDPFGLDGWWWHVDPQVKFAEPSPCPHFRLLQGALDLSGREPEEAIDEVRPGPGAPFVIPRLLDLPGMVAVVGSTTTARGDVAYPIGYFSEEPIRGVELHQSWLRTTHWFVNEAGGTAWTAKNDLYDFELAGPVESGHLRWVDLDVEEPSASQPPSADFPFYGVEGVRSIQQCAQGRVRLLGLPTGVPLDPFQG